VGQPKDVSFYDFAQVSQIIKGRGNNAIYLKKKERKEKNEENEIRGDVCIVSSKSELRH